MKKLLLFLLFVPLISFAQTKIGFKAQNYLNARNNSSSQSISCDDLIKKIKIDGRRLDTSFGGLYSEVRDYLCSGLFHLRQNAYKMSMSNPVFTLH